MQRSTVIGLVAALSAFAWSSDVFACSTPNSSTIYLSPSYWNFPMAQDGSQSAPYRSVVAATNRLNSDSSVTRLCLTNTKGATLDLSNAAANTLTVEGWGSAPTINKTIVLYGPGGQASQTAIIVNDYAKRVTVRNVDIYGAISSQGVNQLILDQVTLRQGQGGSLVQMSGFNYFLAYHSQMIADDVSTAIYLYDGYFGYMSNVDITLNDAGNHRGIAAYDLTNFQLNSVEVSANATTPNYMVETGLVDNIDIINSDFIDNSFLPGLDYEPGGAIALSNFASADITGTLVDTPHERGIDAYDGALNMSRSTLRSATRYGVALESVDATLERSTIALGYQAFPATTAVWVNGGSLFAEDNFLVANPNAATTDNVALRFDYAVDVDANFNSAHGWQAFARLSPSHGGVLSGSLSSRANLVVGDGTNTAALYQVNPGVQQSVALSSGKNLIDSSINYGYSLFNNSVVAEGGVADSNGEAEIYGQAAFSNPGVSPALNCQSSNAPSRIFNTVNTDDFYGRGRPAYSTLGAWECNPI